MSRTSVGTGRAVTSQTDIFSAPLRAYQNPGTVPGVIMCHGYNRLATDITNSAINGEYGIYDALRRRYCVGIGEFSDNAWGNDTALGNVAALDTWMTTMGANSGKRALIAASMGTVTALNYAYNHPSRVACVACFIPVTNPYTNSVFNFVGELNTAYGGSYNDATMGPTHNPGDYAANFPTNIPVHLWYSTGDMTADPANVALFAATCPSATATVVSTTLDHSEAAIAAAPLADVLAFIRANIG